MKIGNVKMTLAAGVLVTFGLMGQAQAYDVDCSELHGISDATDLLSYKKDDDRLGLQNKLTNAGEKIGEGKECDAAQKLRDYRSKLETLLDRGKAAEVHDGTVMCIDLGTQALIDDWDDGTCPDPGDPPRGKGKGLNK